MDIQKLTKKNQEFIHLATNQLIKDGKSDQEIKDILSDVIPELIKNQKKGITGRGFLGAPTVWAASFSPEKHQQAVSGKPSKEIPETDKTPWKMWLDTSLFLLSIVAIMNAIFGFLGNTNKLRPHNPSFSLIYWWPCYVYPLPLYLSS